MAAACALVWLRLLGLYCHYDGKAVHWQQQVGWHVTRHQPPAQVCCRCHPHQVRRNKHVEIVPLSTGCLGACTYCKTKHARGQLGSYDPDALVARVQAAAQDPLVRALLLWRRSVPVMCCHAVWWGAACLCC